MLGVLGAFAFGPRDVLVPLGVWGPPCATGGSRTNEIDIVLVHSHPIFFKLGSFSTEFSMAILRSSAILMYPETLYQVVSELPVIGERPYKTIDGFRSPNFLSNPLKFYAFFLEMGLWTLLEGFLLLANSLAILNEDRFLAPRGWSFQEYSGIKRKSFKGQILGLIYATQWYQGDAGDPFSRDGFNRYDSRA
ncbi:immediate early response 3-interacting protein 1-like [Salvia divinorum]|uniref:Immediate early response 3-interacting protein 1-like n=1 Tax=Salvia divinorum TaxID=28513 RepID=A0ABD1GDL2_SALDI